VTTDFEELKRDSAWPPTANGMPDLPADDYPDTLLWQYVQAREPGSLEGELHSLAVNLARLSDKAVREYRAARGCLTAYVETPARVESLEGHMLLLQATDHLENCLDAVRRAEGYLSTRAFAAVVTPTQQAMLGDLHKGVRGLRNSIQHAEERFAECRVPDGDPLFPAMTNDCVYFAGGHVFYAEVAALLIIVWLLASAGVDAVTPD
jgi:hypothetical protein